MCTSGSGSFDSPTLAFHVYIFFAPFFFLSRLLPLPVLLFQRRGMHTASWIPTQRGEGQHSSSLPRHLICAWQPADRMEWWGWSGGAGGGGWLAGQGKGCRMSWREGGGHKYKKRPDGGGFIGKEMHKWTGSQGRIVCFILFYYPLVTTYTFIFFIIYRCCTAWQL